MTAKDEEYETIEKTALVGAYASTISENLHVETLCAISQETCKLSENHRMLGIEHMKITSVTGCGWACPLKIVWGKGDAI